MTRISATLQVIKGARLTAVLQIYNFDGSIPDVFLETDTLSGKVWLTAGATALIAFTPTWSAFATGKAQVELTEANTGSLDVTGTMAPYNLQVFATRGGKKYGVAWAYLEIQPTAT